MKPTISRKSSNKCIGYRSHVAGPERQQYVAGFEMPVQISEGLIEARNVPGNDTRPL